MKTFKKTAALFIAIYLLIVVLPLAAEADRVVDGAGLMTMEEAQTVRSLLDEISIKYQCDVAIVTTNSAGIKSEYEAMNYADDFFDYNGYGIGNSRDGILLLISIQDGNRFYWFSAHGYGSEAFSDYDTEYMGDKLVPYLKNGEYYSGFLLYAEMTENILEYAANGGTNPSKLSPLDPTRILIALAVGVVISFIIASGMRSKLKSVRMQPKANSYIRRGSMSLTTSRDTFLYSRVNRTERVSDNGAHGSSHTSSSGSTHTGSGGSF